jgi:hypothetical protein
MQVNSTGVKAAARVLLLAAIVLSSCTAARKVAHTSFRVLDAPANFVRRQIDAQENATTTTTTTTTSSDTVTTPGRTVTGPPPTSDTQRRNVRTQDQTRPKTGPSASPRSSPATVTEKSKPSPSVSRNVTTQTEYPTAKPVPGKPGYVFSPFDPSGGYVDVSGYSPGQKVKDPYSGKIFLVP